MNRRNHKELWEQLRTVLMFGGRKRYSKPDLLNMMTFMEMAQLSQDSLNEVLKSVPPKKAK